MFFRMSTIYHTIEIVGMRPGDFDKLRNIFGLYVPELLRYLQHVPEDRELLSYHQHVSEGREGKMEVLAENIPEELFVNAGMLKFVQSEWRFLIQKSKEKYYVPAQ